jgi:uncharacterized OsmC-like protein
MSRLSYEVSARIVHAGVSEIEAKKERVRFDSSPGAGDELPGPAELLCSALAACLLKNVERFSEILPFSQQGASVRVTAERRESPPMFTEMRYELRLITDEPPNRVSLLQRNLAKHGTVYNTLAEVCEIEGEVLAVAPGETSRGDGPP